jgi:hypothetical protein
MNISSKPITTAILRTGLLSDSMLEEMERWGFRLKVKDDDDVQDDEILDTAEEVVECLRDAIESDDAVTLRDTDLDVLSHYLRNQEQGHLMVFDPSINRTRRVAVTYAVLPNKHYAIPWKDESIRDTLLDERSYLRTATTKHVKFEDVEELFFGGIKAFISARPMKGTVE